MGDRFDYWIHGVNTQVQHENRIESIFRGGAGARIRQNTGGNWFQLAIPTPTWLDDDHVDIRHAYLKGEINGQATITRVHIWHGGKPRGRRIWNKNHYSLSARELDENFDISDQRCTHPLVMSIWVNFEESGEIWFAGAGAYFWEHT